MYKYVWRYILITDKIKDFSIYISWVTSSANLFLTNRTNRCTEFQFYWYYDSTCFGQPFCPSSVVLSRCTAKNSWWWEERLPETCRIVIPIKLDFSASVQFHPTPGSKRSSQLQKMYQSRCTAKNSWWWAETLTETCRVIVPIKLEFSASVCFIRKNSVTMHGHMIIKIIG